MSAFYDVRSIEMRIARLRRDLDAAEGELNYARSKQRRQAVFMAVLENIKEGRRINAIKELRSLPENETISLRDSKDIIEFICNNFNPK